MKIFDLFVEGRVGLFSEHNVYKVTGADRIKFFQGQTTNDLISLENGSFHLNSRVDRTGKVQFFFLTLKSEDSLYLIFDNSIASESIDEFNKFIIMDEVEIVEHSQKVYFSIGHSSLSSSHFEGFLFGLPAFIYLNDLETKVPTISASEISSVASFTGWPRLGVDVLQGQLINETRLDELSVNYNKGCFLGQETVAKVHNGRGASYGPMRVISKSTTSLSLGPFEIDGRKGGAIIAVEDGFYFGKVFREFRLENKVFTLTQNDRSIECEFEAYKNQFTKDEFAKDLYHYAVELFQSNKEEEAILYLMSVIKVAPSFADAYEALGVIYGRQLKFEEGIELMNQLLLVDEDSVLAHTNKSLYLMNLGKIEEAEEEKGLATVKSFAMYGKEAKKKKQDDEVLKEKNEQMLQRESMFKQVLEIDSVDTIANYGMADIFFFRKEYEKSKKHLEVVLSEDDKYSMAYLLLGKNLELLNNTTEAREVYKKGIQVASAKGELMPANEMQARLMKLS
ncbi:hypothetical protein [Halobacteriovorax sp. HLS]|uniref:hypothetical protein n=1 Tax=Halobacteriovorax sp. HLS TaxID=2234000 RepID=UPI000FDB43FD|nr:hypothetical protein [Halobacteriovorax sp. HLS]